MSERFEIFETRLLGLNVVARKPFRDDRGFLERIFCSSELEELVGNRQVAQINRSLTVRRGTVRGMHFQRAPHAETKFVACLRGEVYDVAVDLRRHSKTFLNWHGEVLTAANHKTLQIPEGFAHGFQALSDECELLYVHTAAYRADADCGLNAKDPRLGIAWPAPITETSPRDAAHPLLTEDFLGISV